VTPGQRVLIVGRDAVPAAMSALRYPQTVEVVIVDETGALPLGDKRARQVARLEQIPPGWIADLVVVAMPVLTDSLVQAVRLHHRADSGVAAFALARPAQIRQAKEILRKNWSTVQPYRENVPEAVELENRTAWFLLAADHGFKRHRPIPPWAKRLSDKYVPALFTLARDEYTLAYGSGQA
jgi:hypothetical protein